MNFPFTLKLLVLFSFLLAIASVNAGWAVQETSFAEPAQEKSTVDVPDDIKQFFEELGKTLESEEAEGIRRHFSIKRMVESAITRGILTSESDSDTDAIVSAFESSSSESLGAMFSFIRWQDIRFRSLEKQDDGSVQVLVRHWDDDLDTWSLIRWSLADVDGKWKVYDFEDLDMNMKASSMLALGFESARADEPWIRDLVRFIDGTQSWHTNPDAPEDIDTLMESADALLDETLPDEFRSFLLTFKAASLMELEEGLDEAAATVAEMEELRTPPPITLYLRGAVLSAQENYKDSIAAFEEYADLFGWDANTCEVVSDAWWGLRNREQAIEFAEKGLQDTYRSWGCIMSLALALPVERKKEIDPWLEKHSFDEALLETTIDWCLENDDMDGSVHVFRLLKKHHPESELIDYYNDVLQFSDF